jgi:hypothetical protein
MGKMKPGDGIVFVETTIFTRRVNALGLEQGLRDLQLQLTGNPEAGRLDPGTGGLRKVRMGDASRGKGKRSGARVHYLWLSEYAVIYMIFVYSKDESDTLTPDQKRKLKTVVDAIKKEWKGR